MIAFMGSNNYILRPSSVTACYPRATFDEIMVVNRIDLRLHL